jgi:hypothetical protein
VAERTGAAGCARIPIPFLFAGSADILAFRGTHGRPLPVPVLLSVRMYALYRVAIGAARASR